MENAQLTVPARFVNTMLTIAADRECDIDALLQDIGINPKDIAEDKAISVLLYGQLHHHIIELVQDEWFGMLSGGAVPKGAIRLLCQSIVHCRDLEQAIIRAGEFFEVCRGFKVKQILEKDGDQVIFKAAKLDCIEQAEFDSLINNTDPSVIKSTLSAWHGFYSWLIGTYVPIDDIYYNFPSDNGNSSYQGRDKIDHHHSHAFIGHRFNKKFLSYPIVQNENSVEDFMRKAPYYGLIKKNPNEGLAPYVKSLLAKNIGAELPNASEVAECFNMSVTTLHRRLGNENCSFQALKNESRLEAAIHYLNCPDISTATISDLLSFENPSTFYRSFKKWTGLPPGEYRKQLLNDKINPL
ncbi:MAG TPA: AraC family transcriptional regulator [Porticoccus sp.]|nr:AraC family transcriptional regulator [Porticoccus sp.]